MLGESMTARKSSSWWMSIYLFPWAPAFLPARIGIAPLLPSCEIATHSTLRTRAGGKFHGQVPAQLFENECWPQRKSFGSRCGEQRNSALDRSAQRGAEVVPDSLLVYTARQNAAVYHQQVTGDEAGGVRGQEDRRPHQFFELAESLHRRAHQEFAATFGAVE